MVVVGTTVGGSWPGYGCSAAAESGADSAAPVVGTGAEGEKAIEESTKGKGEQGGAGGGGGSVDVDGGGGGGGDGCGGTDWKVGGIRSSISS